MYSIKTFKACLFSLIITAVGFNNLYAEDIQQDSLTRSKSRLSDKHMQEKSKNDKKINKENLYIGFSGGFIKHDTKREVNLDVKKWVIKIKEDYVMEKDMLIFPSSIVTRYGQSAPLEYMRSNISSPLKKDLEIYMEFPDPNYFIENKITDDKGNKLTKENLQQKVRTMHAHNLIFNQEVEAKIGLQTGFQYENLNTEIDLGFHKTNVHVRKSSFFNNPEKAFSIYNWTLLANGRVNLYTTNQNNCFVTPYVGAGLGLQYAILKKAANDKAIIGNDVDLTTTHNNEAHFIYLEHIHNLKNAWDVIYQINAGLNFLVKDQYELFAEYRFQDNLLKNEIVFKADNQYNKYYDKMKIKNNTHIINFGLRIKI